MGRRPPPKGLGYCADISSCSHVGSTPDAVTTFSREAVAPRSWNQPRCRRWVPAGMQVPGLKRLADLPTSSAVTYRCS
eukprot:3803915-Pyramimonas_sp.AAC.1